MTKTLITILGKGRDNPQTGYRPANYHFADGTVQSTPFFGLALAAHLKPKAVVILGTSSSMWGVLIEHFARADENEALRLELMDAESQGMVSQGLLDQVTPLLQESFAHEIVLRLIPQGRDDEQQVGILHVIADSLQKQEAELHFDITHGFRHLAVIGFLSAAMLQRLRKQIHIKGLWYGALEMTSPQGATPVLRLDGLHKVQRWVSALDRFDASGDYGVFAPLLQADGLPEDKANCLVDAAFYEATTQIPNAARSLNTVLPALEQMQTGASLLFLPQLRKHLRWAKEADLAEQQRQLALRAYSRGDLLRCAILGLEALISRRIESAGGDPYDFPTRAAHDKSINEQANDPSSPDWLRSAYNTLKVLRNSMAHGTPPSNPKKAEIMKNRDRMSKELQATLSRLNTPR